MPAVARITTLLAVCCGLAAAQEQALRQAARLDAEGKCGEAEPHYLKALAAAPNSQAVLNNAGNHYAVCGHAAKAQQMFERLLKLNPSHQNANVQLARIATEQKQGAKALGFLSRVKDSGPAVRLLRAEATHWAGKQAQALAMLDAAEKEAGADPRQLFTLGLAYARTGHYERAEAAFGRVVAHAPDNFEVNYNLGRAAARAQHYARAQRALEVAVKLQPANVDALLELGQAHAALQDYARAVFVLAQARQRAPKRADVLLALARAANGAGYYGDSAVAYDEYMQLRPGDDISRRDRARVYALTGTRLAEGLKEMGWYIAKHPADPAGHYNLAQFIWESEPERSLAELATAVRLDPGFASAHYSRGWLLARLGRVSEALPHFQAAVKIFPKNVRVLDQLGVSYLALDRPAEAEAALRRAVQIAPEDRESLMHLGRALMALGREAEAQQYLERFRKLRPEQVRDPRKEAGMIELATMSPEEAARRQIERLRREAKEHQSDPDLQLNLAVLLISSGRLDEGVKEFRDLLGKNIDARLCEAAGKALMRAEQYTLAQEFLLRAAAETPEARLELAIALALSGNNADAQKTLKEIEARWPNWNRAYLAHGLLLEESGRLEEARGRIRTAVELGSREAAAGCAMARLEGADASRLDCRCQKGLRGLVLPDCGAR
jgi:Flp pilus assembly protein TadD